MRAPISTTTAVLVLLLFPLETHADSMESSIWFGPNMASVDMLDPFSKTTVVRFELSAPSWVEVKVFDVRGHVVSTPLDASRVAGKHEIEFAANDLPAGVYFLVLQVDKRIAGQRKLVLVK